MASNHRFAWRVTHGVRLARHGLLTAALGFFGCGPAPSALPPPPPAVEKTASPHEPRLVVLVVVDQLPSWSFEKRARWMRHGFARLMKEGVYYPSAEFPYAATVTAAGHAALVTGAAPREAGLVGNTWYDRTLGAWIQSADDARYPILTVSSSAATVPAASSPDAKDTNPGGSPQQLVVDAVGDSLRAKHGAARVVSVSYKKHPAVLMGGRRPTVAAWYEPSQIAFTTSAYYAKSSPGWLRDLAREHPIATRLDYTWTPLEETPRASGIADDAPGEEGGGIGLVFPHRLSAAAKPPSSVGMTPLGNEIVLEAAIAAMSAFQLGKGRAPDLLAVSFSSHDLVGHAFGQDSWEAVDVLLRLDDAVGRLLAALDGLVGRGGYSLVLTSDHGAPPTPEQVPGAVEPLRIDLSDITARAKAAAVSTVGPGEWVAGASEWMLYLSESARALEPSARGRLLDAMTSAIAGVPGVGYAMRADGFASGCSGLSKHEGLVCRSVYAARTGEIFYGPRENALIIRKVHKGIGHGTEHAYDRFVPLFVLAPGVPPRRDRGEPPSALRVAPTLARMLGVPPPNAAKEPPL